MRGGKAVRTGTVLISVSPVEISVPELLSVLLLFSVSTTLVTISISVSVTPISVAAVSLFKLALVVFGGGILEEGSDVHGGEKRRGRDQGTRRFV